MLHILLIGINVATECLSKILENVTLNWAPCYRLRCMFIFQLVLFRKDFEERSLKDILRTLITLGMKNIQLFCNLTIWFIYFVLDINLDCNTVNVYDSINLKIDTISLPCDPESDIESMFLALSTNTYFWSFKNLLCRQ